MTTAVYPPQRTRAAAPAPGSGGAQQVSLPVSRPWSFAIEANPGLRTTALSPSFSGPAMIYEVTARWAGAATNIGGFGLLWAADSGGEQSNGPLLPLPTGTRIFHPASIRLSGATDLDEMAEHLVEVAPGTDPTQKVTFRPRYVVNTADRFFLKATVRGPLAAGTVHIVGLVVVVEASSLEDLQNFQ